MFGLGIRELIILVAILVLLFGAKKIPELARNLKEAVVQLKKGLSGEEKEKTDKKNKAV